MTKPSLTDASDDSVFEYSATVNISRLAGPPQRSTGNAALAANVIRLHEIKREESFNTESTALPITPSSVRSSTNTSKHQRSHDNERNGGGGLSKNDDLLLLGVPAVVPGAPTQSRDSSLESRGSPLPERKAREREEAVRATHRESPSSGALGSPLPTPWEDESLALSMGSTVYVSNGPRADGNSMILSRGPLRRSFKDGRRSKKLVRKQGGREHGASSRSSHSSRSSYKQRWLRTKEQQQRQQQQPVSVASSAATRNNSGLRSSCTSLDFGEESQSNGALGAKPPPPPPRFSVEASGVWLSSFFYDRQEKRQLEADEDEVRQEREEAMPKRRPSESAPATTEFPMSLIAKKPWTVSGPVGVGTSLMDWTAELTAKDGSGRGGEGEDAPRKAVKTRPTRSLAARPQRPTRFVLQSGGGSGFQPISSARARVILYTPPASKRSADQPKQERSPSPVPLLQSPALAPVPAGSSIVGTLSFYRDALCSPATLDHRDVRSHSTGVSVGNANNTTETPAVKEEERSVAESRPRIPAPPGVSATETAGEEDNWGVGVPPAAAEVESLLQQRQSWVSATAGSAVGYDEFGCFIAQLIEDCHREDDTDSQQSTSSPHSDDGLLASAPPSFQRAEWQQDIGHPPADHHPHRRHPPSSGRVLTDGTPFPAPTSGIVESAATFSRYRAVTSASYRFPECFPPGFEPDGTSSSACAFTNSNTNNNNNNISNKPALDGVGAVIPWEHRRVAGGAKSEGWGSPRSLIASAFVNLGVPATAGGGPSFGSTSSGPFGSVVISRKPTAVAPHAHSVERSCVAHTVVARLPRQRTDAEQPRPVSLPAPVVECGAPHEDDHVEALPDRLPNRDDGGKDGAESPKATAVCGGPPNSRLLQLTDNDNDNDDDNDNDNNNNNNNNNNDNDDDDDDNNNNSRRSRRGGPQNTNLNHWYRGSKASTSRSEFRESSQSSMVSTCNDSSATQSEAGFVGSPRLQEEPGEGNNCSDPRNPLSRDKPRPAEAVRALCKGGSERGEGELYIRMPWAPKPSKARPGLPSPSLTTASLSRTPCSSNERGASAADTGAAVVPRPQVVATATTTAAALSPDTPPSSSVPVAVTAPLGGAQPATCCRFRTAALTPTPPSKGRNPTAGVGGPRGRCPSSVEPRGATSAAFSSATAMNGPASVSASNSRTTSCCGSGSTELHLGAVHQPLWSSNDTSASAAVLHGGNGGGGNGAGICNSEEGSEVEVRRPQRAEVVPLFCTNNSMASFGNVLRAPQRRALEGPPLPQQPKQEESGEIARKGPPHHAAAGRPVGAKVTKDSASPDEGQPRRQRERPTDTAQGTRSAAGNAEVEDTTPRLRPHHCQGTPEKPYLAATSAPVPPPSMQRPTPVPHPQEPPLSHPDAPPFAGKPTGSRSRKKKESKGKNDSPLLPALVTAQKDDEGEGVRAVAVDGEYNLCYLGGVFASPPSRPKGTASAQPPLSPQLPPTPPAVSKALTHGTGAKTGRPLAAHESPGGINSTAAHAPPYFPQSPRREESVLSIRTPVGDALSLFSGGSGVSRESPGSPAARGGYRSFSVSPTVSNGALQHLRTRTTAPRGWGSNGAGGTGGHSPQLVNDDHHLRFPTGAVARREDEDQTTALRRAAHVTDRKWKDVPVPVISSEDKQLITQLVKRHLEEANR